MEKIKIYLSSLIRLILTVASLMLIVHGFIEVWDIYKLNKKCDTQINIVINEYQKQEVKKGDTPISYPIIKYTVNGQDYEYIGKTEVGSYPYIKGLNGKLKYCSYEPEVAVLTVEVKEALYKFIIELFAAAMLIILKVVIGVKCIYDNDL